MVSSVRNNSPLSINAYFLGRTHGAAPNTISSTNLRPASSPTLLPLDTPAQAKMTRAMSDVKAMYNQLKPAATGLELSKTNTILDKRSADISKTAVLTSDAKDHAKQTNYTISTKPPPNTTLFTAADNTHKTALTNMANTTYNSSRYDVMGKYIAEKADITIEEMQTAQDSVDDPKNASKNNAGSPVNDPFEPLSFKYQTQLDQYRTSTLSGMFGYIYSPGMLLDLYA